MANTITAARLQTFYIAYYGRAADPLGLDYWDSVAKSASVNGDEATLVQNLGATSQTEFIAVYGSNPSIATFLNAIYHNLFGRDISAVVASGQTQSELSYWAGQYNTMIAGGTSVNAARSSLVTYIVDGALGTDATAIAAKITYATSFTAAIDTLSEITAFGDLNNTAGYATARAAMNAVVDADTLATQTAAIATTTASIEASEAEVTAPAPITFILSTGVNSGSAFTGAAGNDTFDGSVSSSLSAGDVLNGGSGTDTLTAVLPAVSITPTLTSIETVNITATGNATLDLQTSTGYTTLNSNNSVANTVTFNNIASATTAVGITTNSGVGDTTINYTDAALTGAADSLALTLNGVNASNAAAITITDGGGSNKLETVAITATGVASTVGGIVTTAVGTTGVTVAGSANLTVTAALSTAVATLDATNATGNLSFSLANNATATTITGGAGNDALTSGAGNDVISGGAGNDTITAAAGNDSINGGDGNDSITLSFTTADTVDGGAGTDTLTIDVAVASATTLAAVTNVENLTVTGGAAITLAANVSPTTFTVSDAGASVVTLNAGYTNATTINLGAVDSVVNTGANVELTMAATMANMQSGANVTIAGGTGNDTLNLTADSTATALTTNGFISGVETITIVDSSTAGDDVLITVDAAYATNLTVNASALDAGTGALDEQLTFDGSAQSTSTKTLNVTGGEGNDTITGGAGNDTLIGGGGADSINGATGGNDSISAGDGNDTINMGANLTSSDTIDGGAGTDTLLVTTGLSATALTNVTNVEILALSGTGTATLTANLAFTTVDMSSGATAEALTLSTGYSNATTVTVDAGDSVINNANVTMTVNALAAEMAATTVTGGSGTDSMNITADSGTVTFDSLITKVENITIVDGTGGSDVTLTLGSYGTALTIDGAALDAADAASGNGTAEILTVSGASVTKALTITVGAGGSTITTGTGAFNDVVTGGAGTDSITSGAGNDSYSGGAGVDTFNMSSFLTYQDTIAGGDGTDVMQINAGYSDIDFMNASSIATLTLLTAGTTTLSSFATTAGIATITGLTTGANVISAAGMTTAVTMSGATTDNMSDNLTGGTGNDTFNFSGLTGFETGDSVTGGTGTDTLTIALGSSAGTTEVATLTNVAGIEAITITGTTAGVNLGALTLVDGNFASVTGAAISFAGVTSNATISFNASAEDDSSFIITAPVAATGVTSGNATLVGGALNDTISAGTGSDSITGGLGADVMTGGGGADRFVYIGSGFETGTVSPATVYYGGTVVAGTSVGTASLDKITDFSSNDTIATAAGGAANLATNATGAAWTELAGFLKGAYDSTAQTFTFSTTGSDSLYVYDFDGSNATNDLRAVVLVGYVDSGTTDTGTSGLVGVA